MKLLASVIRDVTLSNGPLGNFRMAVREGVLAPLRSDGDIEQEFGQPAGDPGLFGPSSTVWIVHSDLPAMLVGGISALLLQTLHPLAMAGVADHSNYRDDPLGRLARTAAFIGTTTFGGTESANRAIEVVRVIHKRVKGIAPDGRPYSANDPELLTWIHTAEAVSFLRAFRRFGSKPLGREQIDSYFCDMAMVARKLGATEVPDSWAQVRTYFRRVRSELKADQQALDAISYIINSGNGNSQEEAVRSLIVQAAIGIMPPWARHIACIRQPGEVEGVAIDTAMRAMGGFLRWAVGTSEVLEIARQRCSADKRQSAA